MKHKGTEKMRSKRLKLAALLMVPVLLFVAMVPVARRYRERELLRVAGSFRPNAAVRVEELLAQGVNPNAREGGYKRKTALMCAASYNAATASVLLSHGADVNAKDSEGFTALHIAAPWKPEVARVLLDAGADINAQSNYGQTPLMLAVMHARLDGVRLLLDRGANVNIIGGRSTALSTVRGTMQGVSPVDPTRQEIVRMLKAAGAKEKQWKRLKR